MPADHPLAGRAEVDLEDFADDEWVSWPEGEFCHEWLMFTLRAKGIEPRIAHMAGEHHTQLALIAAGFGVCVTPRLGRGPVPDGVSARPRTAEDAPAHLRDLAHGCRPPAVDPRGGGRAAGRGGVRLTRSGRRRPVTALVRRRPRTGALGR